MVHAAAVKGTLIGLLCLLVFVSVGLNFYQCRAYRNAAREAELRLSENEAPVPAFSETLRDTPDESDDTSSVAEEAATINKLKTELAALEEALEAANSGYAEIMDREDEKKEVERDIAALSLEQIFNSTYMALNEELNLSPEEINAFKDLYIDRSMELREIGSGLIRATESKTEEERDAIRQRREEVGEAYEEKLRDFLGHADYEKYLEYEEMIIPRGAVKRFTETLHSEEALSEGQERELLEIWHSGEAVKDYEERVSYMLEKAGHTLSEPQFEKFDEFVTSMFQPAIEVMKQSEK